MTRVAVTCIQLLRDLEAHRGPLDERGWEVATPEIPGQHLEGRDLVEALRGCVGVIAGDDQFTAEVLDQLPELRVISKWGIGVDGIDHAAAEAHGIAIRNTPGMFDDEVADVTMSYVTMLLRHLSLIDRGVRSGSWPKPPGTSLRGLTLGIVGLGAIGRAVALRALVAGMNPIGTDPSEQSRRLATDIGVESSSFDEVLRRSDVISVNCPLTPETLHLFDDESIPRMRRGTYIVNTGRGAVIETDALVAGLDSGVIAGAALDVLEEEPVTAGHPLTRFDNVVFGSHNASNTLEASARVHDVAIQHLIDELEGR